MQQKTQARVPMTCLTFSTSLTTTQSPNQVSHSTHPNPLTDHIYFLIDEEEKAVDEDYGDNTLHEEQKAPTIPYANEDMVEQVDSSDANTTTVAAAQSNPNAVDFALAS